MPKNIQSGLLSLSYDKPSIIQGVSLRKILDNPKCNFAFQAINGSGKTGAFLVPSLMRVDPACPNIQVVVLAHSRELIRQIYQVALRIGKDSGVKIALGESNSSCDGAQLLVTTPGYLNNQLTSRSGKLDLKALKMLVYDEVDELLIQDSIRSLVESILKVLTKLGCEWQSVLFSATYNDSVVERIKELIGETEIYQISKEALKLKGVKNFVIHLNEAQKVDFACELHQDLD